MAENTTLGWDGNKILDCRYDDYKIKHDEWKAIELALESGEKWIDFKLKRFDGECTPDFEARKDAASNVLKVSTALQSMQNLARGSMDQARIEGASNRVKDIVDNDFDNNGNSWKNWVVDQALLNVPAFGKYWMFASSPANNSPIMLSEEKDNNPFVFGRRPLQVLNFTYENGDTLTQGQYSDVLVLTSEVVTNRETMFRDTVNIAVRFTREWTYVLAVGDCKAYNQTGGIQGFSRGDVIRMYPNESGIVTARSIDIGESLVKEVVNLSAQAMNVQSAAYIGTVDANFSQRWTAGEEIPKEYTTGEKTTIAFKSENASYNIAEAPSGTIENSIKSLDHIQGIVDIIMQNNYQNLAKKGGNAPSGEALTEMNAAQAQAVGYLMDMIGDALSDIVAWLHVLGGEEVPKDLKVVMPSTYESTSQKDNMELAIDSQELEAHSEEALRIRIANIWSPITPSEDLEAVVEAEMAAALPLMKANNILKLASADNLDLSDDGSGGDVTNQPEGEGSTDEI